jgi:tetratricopeptide (TPR) repeat protein
MKPKIFIGSSVEGLSVAYSIQQNLTHDADVTVWDQGVFELSKTTIESLLEILGKSDFGIFVFSPDDISIIRKEGKNVVRDNVLFEFGLFIGKIGRERVFFIIPSDTDLHLPTDLIGITPGKYNPNREDKSLQAATGPVCHQIRLQIKKTGNISNEETSREPDKKNEFAEKEESWIEHFLNNDFGKARELLEKKITSESTPDELLDLKIWLAYCLLKDNEHQGLFELNEIKDKNSDNWIAYRGVARVLLWEDYLDKAIEILNIAIDKFKDQQALVILLSECYNKSDSEERALEYLLSQSPDVNIDIALEIVKILSSNNEYDKAREIIHKCYLNFPNNEKLRYNYARLALEMGLNEIAFYFLNSLTIEFPKVSNYWGYLSNCCISLDLYDLALVACRNANELTNEKEEWINSNIGNIFKNKGFYTEGIFYLEKGLQLNRNSDYAHDRLATSIRLRQEERDRGNLISDQGRKKIRQFKLKE